MIDLKNVSYETNSRELFSDVSFAINAGDKIGLVGLNGVGKTTLLKIINGDIQPTSGDIISSGEEIGILPQNLNKWLDKTVYDFIEEVTVTYSVINNGEKIIGIDNKFNIDIDSKSYRIFKLWK